jgi:hypothetical protein
MGAAAGLAANSVAHAALLEPVRGSIRLNHGEGYLAVHGVTDVNPGDQVMVGPKGQARLVYPDGCKVSLKPGPITVIGEKSPCTTQTTLELPADALDPALVVAGALAAAGAGIGVGVASSSGHAPVPFFSLPAVPASP